MKKKLFLFPVFLVIYELAAYLTMDAFLPALPIITRDFGITHNFGQLTFTLWFLGGVSTQFILGPLTDRCGRRPVLLLGGTLFVVASVGCGLADSMNMFLLARFLQGAAVPSMIVAGYAAIHESLDTKEAIHTIAVMGSVTILAPAFGPLLGGIILAFRSWQSIFEILAIWGSLALALLYFFMPETLSIESRQTELKFKPVMQNYYQVISNYGFMKNILGGTFAIGGLMAWMFVGPFLVIDQFSYSTIQYGFFQAAVFACFTVAMIVIKRVMMESNMFSFIRVGLGINAVGACCAIVTSTVFPHMLFPLVSSIMTMSFGAGLCFPVLSRLAIESSEAPMGIRMTVLSSMQMLIATVASASVALFFTGTLFSLAIIVAFFSCIACAIRLR